MQHNFRGCQYTQVDIPPATDICSKENNNGCCSSLQDKKKYHRQAEIARLTARSPRRTLSSNLHTTPGRNAKVNEHSAKINATLRFSTACVDAYKVSYHRPGIYKCHAHPSKHTGTTSPRDGKNYDNRIRELAVLKLGSPLISSGKQLSTGLPFVSHGASFFLRKLVGVGVVGVYVHGKW